jgi:CBS domain-containing protein
MTERSGGTVRDFMNRYLKIIPLGTTIVEVAERMREKSLGSLLVESHGAEGRVFNRSGIVTETDLIRKVLAKGIDPSLAMVDQIMTSPLLTITPDRPMLDASHLMETNHVRYLCASDKDDIVGIISKGAPSVTSTTSTGHSACSCERRWRLLRVSGQCRRRRS